MDDGTTEVEIASNEMAFETVRASREFSVLVSQQNNSDLSLKGLDDALKQFSQKIGIFWEKKMAKSAKAKVDNLLAMESN